MLKFIRRNAEAAWVKFIFAAIVIVFIFWGMGGIVGGEKAQVVARVNGEPIDPVEFSRAYNNLLRLYQDIYKDNLPPEMLKAFDLKSKAVDQLIRVSLMRQEADRIGLRVGETEVRDAIAVMPTFQQDGRFSKDLYLRALRANSITPGEFEDAQREQLLVSKLQDLILAGVHVGDVEIHDRYQFENEKVNLRFVKLAAADVLSEVTLSDPDVQAYFDTHQDGFLEPDRVRVEYVLYAPEKFTDKAQITDAEVQRYYDGHQSEFERQEQVSARHILFKVAPTAGDDEKAKVHQKAEEVLAKVKAGEDFAALAKQFSEDGSAAQGGDLGSFTRGKMVKPFEEAAFALAPGETSNLVESPFGLHIIKVEAKQEAGERPLDEVRVQIVTSLQREKTRQVAQTQTDADHAKVAGGEPLANVAQAAGLTMATPPPFARGEAVSGLGLNPPFTNAALGVEAGAVGPVVDTPAGFIIFRVIEKLPAHVPPLAEIHDRVASSARNDRAGQLATTKAETLLAELKKSDIDTVAKTANAKVDETGPFNRQVASIPKIGNAAELKKDAFQLTAEKPVAPAVYSVSGSSVIAVLKERVPADEEQFKTEKDRLMQQAEERRKAQTIEEFVNYLKARAAVQLDQEYIASVPDTGHPLDGSPRRRR